MGDVTFLKSEYTPLSLRVIEEELPPRALAPFATLGADERWLYDILSEAQARADRLAADYCYEFGSQLVNGRRYRAAWAMLETALEIYLQHRTPPTEQIDRVLAALAQLLEGMLPDPDTLAYLERARFIWGAVRGPEHPELAEILSNLGYVRKRRAELAAARDCYRQALAIWQATLEPDHPYLATAYNNLGTVAREAGQPTSAKRNYEKALTLSRAATEPQQATTATILTNLAAVCHGEGEDTVARRYLERALALLEGAASPATKALAGAHNSLGHLLLAQGRHRQARRHLERALMLYEETPETTATEVVCVSTNLAAAAQAGGDTAAALQALGRAYLIQRRLFGPHHPRTTASFDNLQQVLAGSDRPQHSRRSSRLTAATTA